MNEYEYSYLSSLKEIMDDAPRDIRERWESIEEARFSAAFREASLQERLGLERSLKAAMQMVAVSLAYVVMTVLLGGNPPVLFGFLGWVAFSIALVCGVYGVPVLVSDWLKLRDYKKSISMPRSTS